MCGLTSHFNFCGNVCGRKFKIETFCEERENQQDATIRCLLSTSVPTCFRHHYAHLQEIKDRVTAYGVLRWFCWMWLVAVVRRCVVGCEQLLDVVGSGCGALRCRM